LNLSRQERPPVPHLLPNRLLDRLPIEPPDIDGFANANRLCERGPVRLRGFHLVMG
jgi:hypothetical protein